MPVRAALRAARVDPMTTILPGHRVELANRYLFPPLLKIVNSLTASACGYVLRTSTRLVHCNRFAVRYQSSSGVFARPRTPKGLAVLD